MVHDISVLAKLNIKFCDSIGKLYINSKTFTVKKLFSSLKLQK
jgi:hypothetical protein